MDLTSAIKGNRNRDLGMALGEKIIQAGPTTNLSEC